METTTGRLAMTRQPTCAATRRDRKRNIVNDFTPEEEAQVREENKWCEEEAVEGGA